MKSGFNLDNLAEKTHPPKSSVLCDIYTNLNAPSAQKYIFEVNTNIFNILLICQTLNFLKSVLF